MSNLFTTGQIAEKLDERIERVLYIIRRERLKPIERVGLYRLFNAMQVAAIKEALFNIRIQK